MINRFVSSFFAAEAERERHDLVWRKYPQTSCVQERGWKGGNVWGGGFKLQSENVQSSITITVRLSQLPLICLNIDLFIICM